RISKVDPDLAKQEGEKAMNDPVGFILTNEDNFNHSLHGSVMPLWQICQSWNDTRMGAGMEEVLLGYNDPRLEKWFQRVPASVKIKKGEVDVEVKLDSLWADHPDKPYKGIASGSYIAAKDDRLNYSKVSTFFQTVNERKLLQAAEVNFALAEAKLRGWTGANATKTVGEYYEDGVRASMAEWNVTGAKADAYIADDTSLPINYVDPVDSQNSYETRQKLTIKWDDAAEPEVKLERIMTQKWIASFTNANEIWSDHRRTGYPKLHYVPKNDSNELWGTIGREDFIKRMPFVLAERQNNAAGLVEATKKLGPGGDKISTRLWIHPEGPNF
ncbi:MAG: SusD/RagB family nutrient-binding outer membrane lipoprotein, partial [Bacteroidales bacterium]|nr:SusD/RagB family nutrient-binding outer membrane lipoprotein [Bacteroidales bacterium]